MRKVEKICHVEKFLLMRDVEKIYVKSALRNCLKMALYHQGQQIRLLSNQGAQGGTAQPTFLFLILLLDLSSPSALQNK